MEGNGRLAFGAELENNLDLGYTISRSYSLAVELTYQLKRLLLRDPIPELLIY